MSPRQTACSIVAGIGFVVFALFFYLCCWVTVPKGHTGVTEFWGDVSPHTLQPGPHVMWPWTTVRRMSCQTQKDEEQASVPTSNGLVVGMKATMLYHLRPEHAPDVAKAVGHADYQATVVSPRFKNAVRDVTAKFPPEAFYSGDRSKIEAELLVLIGKELPAFEIETVMLLDPVFPQVVQDRIQAKVAAEQDAIRMQSVFLQRELEGKANKRVKELDAEAKVIEAKGIAEAQSIIQKDLSGEYLIYLWIDALKEGAKHNNTTIYVPTGTDGMPMFRGVNKAPAPAHK